MKKVLLVVIILALIAGGILGYIKYTEIQVQKVAKVRADALDMRMEAERKERMKILEEELAIRKMVTPELKELLKGFKKDKDEFKGVTFYKNYDPYNWTSCVRIYLVSEGKDVFGRLKISYTADDWLFINDYIFLCDGKRVTYKPDEQFVRDNSGGDIYETSDEQINKAVLSIVKRIAEAKVVKMRYNGRDYFDERTIGGKEHEAIKQMYNILK